MSASIAITVILVAFIAASAAYEFLRKSNKTASKQSDSTKNDIGKLADFGIDSDKHSIGSDLEAPKKIIDLVINSGKDSQSKE